jgi:cytoskeletal protein RodZ
LSSQKESTVNLEQIGQQLKMARDAMGLSLNQISERTKIPLNHLESLDSGRTEDLPEPVYVSGFIKRYAECVGLDAQELSDLYRKAVDGTEHSNGRFAFLRSAPKEQTHMAPTPAPVYIGKGGRSIEQSAPNPLKEFFFYGFWIFVVIGLVAVLMTSLIARNNENNLQDSSVMSLKNMANKIGSVPATTTTLPNPNEPPVDQAPPQHTDARISLSASKRVWIEVKTVSSGDTVFTGSLERGDRKDFQDSQGLRVRVGDGGSLTIDQDGKSQTFGEAGKKAERVFMAKNADSITADASDKSKTTPGATTTPAVTPGVKKTIVKKAVSVTPRKHLDNVPSHREMPGESVGIDVPYRY